ncbi:MAG: alpha-galactosidase [Opitutae bacterium]|nr:alpha-galactosidase [Opitutae bacterium]
MKTTRTLTRALALFLTLGASLASAAAVAAEPAIRHLAKRNVWLINLAGSQYALGLTKEKELVHLWWGAKLPAGDYERGVVARIPVRSGFPEAVERYELPPWGGAHQIEPALKLRFADGVRDLRLAYAAHEVVGENELVINLADPHYPLQVAVHYRAHPRFDVLERWVVLKNTGSQPIDIEQALSAAWHLPLHERWTFRYLAGFWGAETQVRDVELQHGKFQIESRRGATSHQFNPWFAVRPTGETAEEQGEVWFGSLAWSGCWKIAAEVTSNGRLQVLGGIHDFDFSWRLAAGESFTTPAFVGGYANEGMGGVSRRLTAYQLAAVLPQPQAGQLRPVIYNSWYATEFSVNAAQQIALAEKAKLLGVELFVMDDGWFGQRKDARAGLGDWTPNAEKFPQGLKPLTDAVHGLGMKFGLWVEPEMVNPDSDLYRAHPDWVFHFPTRPRTQKRHQMMLNFARAEVREHIFQVLDRLLTDSPIDFIKWDMNRHVTEAGWMEAPAEQQREVLVRHVRAVYEIFDRLRARHPQVLWETCSGGGARVDLGIFQRTDQAWASDNTDPLDRLQIQEGYTQAYAPKTMVAWVTDNPDTINKRDTPLTFRFHCAMMGALGVGGNLLKWSEAEMSQTRFWVETYKAIRPLVQEGQLYRLRSPRTSAFSAAEYAAADGSAAVVFAFLQASSMGKPTPPLALRGLTPEAVYQVEAIVPPGVTAPLAPHQASGAALMAQGLTLKLRGDYASALVRLTRLP